MLLWDPSLSESWGLLPEVCYLWDHHPVRWVEERWEANGSERENGFLCAQKMEAKRGRREGERILSHCGLLEVVEHPFLQNEPSLMLRLILPSLLGQPSLSLGVEKCLRKSPISIWNLKLLSLHIFVELLSIRAGRNLYIYIYIYYIYIYIYISCEVVWVSHQKDGKIIIQSFGTAHPNWLEIKLPWCSQHSKEAISRVHSGVGTSKGLYEPWKKAKHSLEACCVCAHIVSIYIYIYTMYNK